jgi:hypothetical protein
MTSILSLVLIQMIQEPGFIIIAMEVLPSIVKIFPGCQIRVVTEFTDDLYKKELFVHIKDGHSLKTLRCDDEGIEITENIQDAGI